MQHSQKAAEPTMEEILASIRKIIAEDPNSPPVASPTRTPTPPAQPPAQTQPPVAPSPARVAPAPQLPAPRAGSRSTSALDRDLADLLGEPGTDATPPKGAMGSVKSTPGDQGIATASVPEGNAKATAGAPNASESPAPSSRLGWLRGRPGSTPASTEAEPAPNPPASASAAKLAETQPALKPVIAGPRSLVPPAAGTSEPAKPNAAIAAAAAVTSKAAAASTPAVVPAPSPSSDRVNAASSAQQTRPVSGRENSALTSQPADKKEHAVSPAKPDILPIDTAPPPARMYAAPVSAGSQQREVAATLSRSDVGAALDDALAQLLRPMVREWLDENMARALTKAVEIEIAERAQKELAKRRTS
ncbi:MAG: DUF2497 domain-containing protein [Hyphomicrobiaceae bacterium]